MDWDELKIINPALATIDVLDLPELEQSGIRADVLRLDKIHPVVSGNKWFKLKGHLQMARKEQARQLITFGGAWSNHIIATAYTAKAAGLPVTGIIRGERAEPISATLRAAASYGMCLEFISREEYKKKNRPEFLEKLSARLPRSYIIPEGGAGKAGVEGSQDILKYVEKNVYTHILCAVGTGTLYQGLLAAALPCQKLIGISVLKGIDSPGMKDLLADRRPEVAYDFGGYAHKTVELLDFMNQFYRSTGIPSDFVYTGKLFYAVMDMVGKNIFPPGSRLLLIHSGGLQGNASLAPGLLEF